MLDQIICSWNIRLKKKEKKLIYKYYVIVL